MRYIHFALTFSGLFLIFVGASLGDLSEPGIIPVFLYNSTTKDLKTRCFEVKGKFDPSSHYECYDKYNSLKLENINKEWKAIPLKSVCLRHVIQDTIKVSCFAYRLREKDEFKYFCLDEKAGKFEPHSDTDWEILEGNDSECMSRVFGPDVIREFKFDIKFNVFE